MATKKSRYTLYLDESQTHKYNPASHKNEQYHFCMAGIIIADDDYAKLEKSVNTLKRTIWPDFQKTRTDYFTSDVNSGRRKRKARSHKIS